MKKLTNSSAWNLRGPPPESNNIRQRIEKLWRGAVGFSTAVWKANVALTTKILKPQPDGLDEWRRLEFNKPLPKGNRNQEEK